MNGNLKLASSQVFDVVVETDLAGDSANSNEHRSLKQGFAKAKNEAGLLRAQIAIHVASAQENGCKLEIEYVVSGTESKHEDVSWL